MNDRQIAFCVNEIENYSDKQAYVSDICLSSIWGLPEDEEIPEKLIQGVGDIWDAAHRNVKEISEIAGISGRKMAERFGIPYRTMENWSAGKRKCHVYVLLMMQECLGVLKVKD